MNFNRWEASAFRSFGHLSMTFIFAEAMPSRSIGKTAVTIHYELYRLRISAGCEGARIKDSISSSSIRSIEGWEMAPINRRLETFQTLRQLRCIFWVCVFIFYTYCTVGHRINPHVVSNALMDAFSVRNIRVLYESVWGCCVSTMRSTQRKGGLRNWYDMWMGKPARGSALRWGRQGTVDDFPIFLVWCAHALDQYFRCYDVKTWSQYCESDKKDAALGTPNTVIQALNTSYTIQWMWIVLSCGRRP